MRVSLLMMTLPLMATAAASHIGDSITTLIDARHAPDLPAAIRRLITPPAAATLATLMMMLLRIRCRYAALLILRYAAAKEIAKILLF